MEKEILNHMKQRTKFWWTSVIVGIVSIILGICCIATPDKALIALTYYFVVGFFISGILDIIFAVSNRKIMSGWGWTLAGGIIDILFGILLVALPLPVMTMMLIYFVGFWILFRSIWTIGIATELNNYVNVAGLLVTGILSLLFSIFYLFSPAFGGIAIIVLACIAFISYGIFRIYYAFKIKKINKRIKELLD